MQRADSLHRIDCSAELAGISRLFPSTRAWQPHVAGDRDCRLGDPQKVLWSPLISGPVISAGANRVGNADSKETLREDRVRNPNPELV